MPSAGQRRPAEGRAFSSHEIAARAWFYLSPFPAERGLAARRFREMLAVVDEDHALQAIGELALEGYHAEAISALIVSDRIRQIPNETMARRVAALLKDLGRTLSHRPHRRGGE